MLQLPWVRFWCFVSLSFYSLHFSLYEEKTSWNVLCYFLNNSFDIILQRNTLLTGKAPVNDSTKEARQLFPINSCVAYTNDSLMSIKQQCAEGVSVADMMPKDLTPTFSLKSCQKLFKEISTLYAYSSTSIISLYTQVQDISPTSGNTTCMSEHLNGFIPNLQCSLHFTLSVLTL